MEGSSAGVRLLASAIGAGIAEATTLPTDVAKVRLQLQSSSLGELRYHGMVDCIMKVARVEGLRALWKGIVPALIRQVSYHSFTFVLYEPIRDMVSLVLGMEAARSNYLQRLLAAGTSAAIAIVLFNPTEMYGHSVGIYNCKAGDFNASDVTVTSSFDYKSFMEKHPDWKELKRGMVPQVQAPAKLSMMEMWSKGLPEDLQKCMTEKKGFMCRVQARLGFAFNFVVALLGKLVDFLFNVVLGVLKFVRFTLFTVMSFVHKDLAGWRRWGGKCDFASDATSTLELDMPIQDNILGDSLCFQGAEFRPCGEVDLAEYIS